MAVTRASKLISLTSYNTGSVFLLSCNKIISFTQIGASDTLIYYINQRGQVTSDRVLEDVATIHTATLSNTLFATQAITLLDGTIVYINNDKVIFLDSLLNSSPLIGKITYDAGANSPTTYSFSAPTVAAFNTAAGNTFAVTTQDDVSNGNPSRTRYINNLFIGAVTNASSGCNIFYDNKQPSFTNIAVQESVATILADVNAL